MGSGAMLVHDVRISDGIEVIPHGSVLVKDGHIAAIWDGMADVRSAGTGATAPGGYPWSLVERGVYSPFPTLSRPEEAEEFVRDRVTEGSDYLKVIVEDGSMHQRRLP